MPLKSLDLFLLSIKIKKIYSKPNEIYWIKLLILLFINFLCFWVNFSVILTMFCDDIMFSKIYVFNDALYKNLCYFQIQISS